MCFHAEQMLYTKKKLSDTPTTILGKKNKTLSDVLLHFNTFDFISKY